MSRMKLFALEEDEVLVADDEMPEMVESVDEAVSDGSVIENDVDVVQDSSEQIGDLKEATDVLTEAVVAGTPITNEALEQFVILRDNVYKNLGLDPALKPSYLRTAQESISTKQALKFALEEEKGFIKTAIKKVVEFFKNMLAKIKEFFGKIFGAKAKVDKGLKDAPAKVTEVVKLLTKQDKVNNEKDTFLFSQLFSKASPSDIDGVYNTRDLDRVYSLKITFPWFLRSSLEKGLGINRSNTITLKHKCEDLTPVIQLYDYLLKTNLSDELNTAKNETNGAQEHVYFLFLTNEKHDSFPVEQYQQYFAKGIEWNNKLIKFTADNYKKEDVVKDIEGVIVEAEKSAKDTPSTESISLENDSGVSPEEHRKQVAERVKEAVALNKMALQSAMEFLAILDKAHTFTRKEYETKQNGLKAIAS